MFTHKLVAVINKDLEPGVALNALAHMTLGLGAHVNKALLRLDTYKDANGNNYPNISQMPFIILRGNSNEIRKTIASAKEQSIEYGIFLNTMTGGTYQEQLERTLQTQESALVYCGCVLFGPWEAVSILIKKLSLWK